MSEQTQCERANRLMRAMQAVKAPPGFAKALSEVYRNLKAFLLKFKPEDDEQRARFFAKMPDIEFVVKDMQQANTEANDPKATPLVCVPSGIWEYILGEEHVKPPDGAHLPEDRPDGPMTWKK